MASTILRKEDLPVDEISTNIRNLVSSVKSDSVKNLRSISQGLSLSKQLDSEEFRLEEKQRKINLQKISETSGLSDRYQEGYNVGTLQGFQTGFEQGLKKGVEYGQTSVLEEIIERLGGKKAAIVGMVLTALGLEGLRQYIDAQEDDTDDVSPYLGPVTGETFMPLPGGTVGAQPGQEYGASRDGGRRRHQGVDIVERKLKDSRAPFVAYKTGKVTSINPDANLPGGTITIDHGNGLSTRYVHITPRDNLKVGDTVYGGQELGRLHQYYSSSGQEQTHLHFEVYRDGALVDPTDYATGAKNRITAPLTDERSKKEHESKYKPKPPEPDKPDGRTSSLLMQDVEPKGMIVAYQPIQSQTVVNNQMGGNGGGVMISSGDSSDYVSRIINLAKSIS